MTKHIQNENHLKESLLIKEPILLHNSWYSLRMGGSEEAKINMSKWLEEIICS